MTDDRWKNAWDEIKSVVEHDAEQAPYVDVEEDAKEFYEAKYAKGLLAYMKQIEPR